MHDVVIVGAGLIGCATAWTMRQRGMSVLLLERSTVGAEAASHAAAGILGAQVEWHGDPAMQRLCLASRDAYPDFERRVREASEMTTGFRRSGALRVGFDEAQAEALRGEVLAHQQVGLHAEWLSGSDARAMEPGLADTVCAAASFPDDSVIDPPSLLKATRAAAERSGVVVREGAEVAELLVTHTAGGNRVDGVRLASGDSIRAGNVVLTAGSWSTLVGGLQPLGLAPNAIRPVRGQILRLRAPTAVFQAVIDTPDVYLSPRQEGHVVVGATVENVGFERRVTAEALQQLLAGCMRVAPGLKDATFEQAWCGFRACCDDTLPVIGQGPADNVWICSGHYRNGVLLAPISAQIMAALLANETPPVEIAPFSVDRLGRDAE